MRRRILALVFDGFEMLDLFGPLEMLCADHDILLVAEAEGTVTASGGPRVAVDATLSALTPGAEDVLLIPGGAGTRREVDNPALIAGIDRIAGTAGLTATVCTGAALLARTGRIDGRPATTNKRAFDWVVSTRPAVDWQRSARWVEDGAVFTSSGVAAGMDMALALLARLSGEAVAEARARRVEHLWRRDPADDPFAIDPAAR